MRLVMRTGDAAPGVASGSVFMSNIDDFVALSSGRVAFVSRNGTNFAVGTGVWIEESGGLHKVLVLGDPASNEPGDVFQGANPWVMPGLDDSLLIDASATLGAGYWRYASGALTPLVRNGWPAPGLEPGVTFSSVERFPVAFDTPKISGTGHFAFSARLAGPGVTTENDDSTWLVSPTGEMVLAAREGATLPSLPSDTTLAFVRFGDVDYGSRCAFSAQLVTPGGRFSALLAGPAGAATPVITAGEPLPEFGPSATSSAPLDWWYQADGQMAFFARVQGVSVSPFETLIVQNSEGRRFVVQQGSPVPGFDSATVVSVLGPGVNWPRFSHSPSGRLAYKARLAGPDIAANDMTLWGVDRFGRSRLPVREGDTVELPFGPTRIVANSNQFTVADNGHLVAYLQAPLGDMIASIAADCPLPGCDAADVAGYDCRVDLADLATVLANFGRVGGPADLVPGDADLDRDVDLDDLAEVLAAIGANCVGG